jgi:uncharacterized membrane protein
VIAVLAYMYNHMSWGWGILMTLGWVILLGLFVMLLVSPLRGRGSSSSPREVLDKRLAAGEITIEEYERARGAMSGDPGRRPTSGPPAAAG